MAVYTGKVNLINMSNITATAGVGIQRTEVLYATSNSGSVPPDLANVELTTENGVISFSSIGTSFQVIDDILWAQQGNQSIPLTTDKNSILIGVTGWSPEFPEVKAGDYLWIKTIYYYTNNTQTVVYSVSRQGEDGKQGPAGTSTSTFKLSCNQTEILKFIDSATGNTTISPSILTVSVLKDDPMAVDGVTQIINLDASKFQVQVYNLDTGEWYSITDPEIISLDSNHIFSINLQGIMEKGYEEENLAANKIRHNECILKISYELVQINEQGENEQFNLNEFLNIRYGMNKDMASLSVKAGGIVAAMQDSRMVFDASGLTLQNGALQIVKTIVENGESKIVPLLYADELGNLTLRGTIYAENGTFAGALEAATGSFAGELRAASGTFTGTLEAASGTFAGDISAASGTIGGFSIENGRLVSTNDGNPNIILDGANGNIEANNITLGTGATIKEYIKIGEQVELKRVDASNDSFIRVMNNASEILALKANGTMKIGDGNNTIILSGVDGSITSQSYEDGLGWKISNTNSIFNDVTVKGSIRASVLEYGETQAIGGALLVRPSTRILSASVSGGDTTLVLEEIRDFKVGDYCRIDSQTATSIGHTYYSIISVDTNNKKIVVSGDASGAVGKPIVNFGQDEDNIGISINGSTDESFSTPQSISVFEFNPVNKIITPRVVLGKLPNEEGIYGYAAGSYGLYAENVLLKGSLVTQAKTEDRGFMYSGISTAYSGANAPKSTKLTTKIPNHTASEILLWAGAEKDDQASIEASKFFVDRNGNMYAGSGYFEGTIITDAIIKASVIETTTLRGYGEKPALKIEDAAKGIYFTTKDANNKDVTVFEVNKDSIIANVSNFVFNSNFTIGGNGSLVVPNLYVIGADAGTTISDETGIQAIMFDNKRIAYSKNFKQNELNGNTNGYIDFNTIIETTPQETRGMVFSPDGISQVLTLAAQEVRVKGENTSLYLENSIKYGRDMEYKPVKDNNGNLIGYDLYIE